MLCRSRRQQQQGFFSFNSGYSYNFVNDLAHIVLCGKGCGKDFINPSILLRKTKNLSTTYSEKEEKPLSLWIPSVNGSPTIIFHLQRKHKFHPRPESSLHLPTEEPSLGYLKFSAKGTKREVFGMPIPNELITDDIRGADYYDAYLENVNAGIKEILLVKK
ncbi:hypothetical protein Tco_0746129 [Tanacetum coccineum]